MISAVMYGSMAAYNTYNLVKDQPSALERNFYRCYKILPNKDDKTVAKIAKVVTIIPLFAALFLLL